jgi:hypothetical protein
MTNMTNNLEQHSEYFKKCPCCAYTWATRADFLEDPAIEIIGYQVNFVHPEQGFFLSNHLTCKTTMAISTDNFLDLYDGPIFSARLIGTDECPEYCLYEDDLRVCSQECECAQIREIIQIIMHWPKKHFQSPN